MIFYVGSIVKGKDEFIFSWKLVKVIKRKVIIPICVIKVRLKGRLSEMNGNNDDYSKVVKG